jgi:hypothetical protein
MVESTCTIYITIRVTDKSLSDNITRDLTHPLGARPPVLSNRDVLLKRSLSHRVTQENHLEYHIVSTLYTKENDTPITWAPSPLTRVHIVSSQTTHPSYGHPHPTGAYTSTHPSHGHTQLMGSLTGRLTPSQRRTCPGGCLMKL